VDASAPGRSSSEVIAELAALVGLAGLAVGVSLLATTDLGFDRGAAIAALATWIPSTLPVALAVLIASAAELAAGVALARFARGRPFEHLDEALLQGFVLAVVKDVLLLGALAGSGLFLQPILIAVDVLIVAVAVVGRTRVVTRSAVPTTVPVSLFGMLVIAAWAAPVLLQLASPVVPFLDVLPNHVAPAEHLRTFGALSQLTDTQSPIYGPSRIFLGYTALLGTITTWTGIPAGQAIAGFILPETILVAIAVRRLAVAAGGDGVGRWVLVTVAMTTTVARLGDARATVVVLPLAAWVLATVADAMRGAEAVRPGGASDLAAPAAVAAAASGGLPGAGLGPRLFPPQIVAGLGLGAAMLVHPVIGFLTALTIVLIVLVRPERIAALGVPALATGAVVALPQAATMVGIPLPPLVLVAAVGVALAAGHVLSLAVAAPLRLGLVALGRGALALLVLATIVFAGPVVGAAVAGADPLVSVMELTVVAAVAAVALAAPAARQPVVWAALAAGFGVATVTQLVPEGSGMLGDALRFELPKTLQYWVPIFVALLAAAGIDAALHHERLPAAVGGIAVIAFVGSAALPIRSTPIDAFHLGEHRLSETLSIAMRWVETGFWAGYPDSRYLVDAPRQAILDAVRVEIAAGRIGPDTPVLHVAGSFQQWVATPLGVFDGVTETDVSPDAEVSIHTVGGRLHPITDLASLLAAVPPAPGSPATALPTRFPYVLLEPDPAHLPDGIRDQIIAAGYDSVYANQQGELFALRPSIR
jgi:hypothetical protein